MKKKTRMTRSLWKGPFVDSFMRRISGKKFKISSGKTDLSNWKSQKEVSGKIEKIWSRRSVILPQFSEKIFEIYNGKQFIKLKVSEDMIGHKFGEFALSRKKPRHPDLKSKLRKK